MVVSLQEIINFKMHGSFVDFVSEFSCMDKDVELFLKRKAYDFERRNKSRTYLILDGNGTLLAYFTLSLKALSFSDNVSKNTIKDIDGFSKTVQSIGIILIGQFGKDMVTAKDVDGKVLFDICIETVYNAQKIIGGRFVMLECYNTEKIVSFYKENGFEVLQYDEKDKYLQMVRRL